MTFYLKSKNAEENSGWQLILDRHQNLFAIKSVIKAYLRNIRFDVITRLYSRCREILTSLPRLTTMTAECRRCQLSFEILFVALEWNWEWLCWKLLSLENPFEFIWNLKSKFELWKLNSNLKIFYPVWKFISNMDPAEWYPVRVFKFITW